MRFISPEGHRDDVAHQEEMKRNKGCSNAESLFELVNIPSPASRIAEGPVLPKRLAPMYRMVFQGLEQNGILDTFRSYSNSLLIAPDGTEYFSSQKIHGPNCSHRELANGKTNYFHSVLTPGDCASGQ